MPMTTQDQSFPSASEERVALVATLGGKPQVLTFALDALIQQGTVPQRVYALHLAPSDPRVARSLARLREEFERYPRYGGILFESFTVRKLPAGWVSGVHESVVGQAIERVDHPEAANAIWLTTHRLLKTLKQEEFTVRLLVTGGPRLLALQALSAAMLLFDLHDECFHLYTPPELRERAGEGAVMHRSSADPPVRLVRVPLMPMVMFAPGLQEAARLEPEKLLQAERQLRPSAHDVRCAQQVIARLSSRQREVLRAIAQPGATYGSVSQQLGISPKTLESHLRQIYEECRIAWELGQQERVGKHFLQAKFARLLTER